MGTAAGWKGKGGSTFFGAERIRLKSTQERRGRYAKQVASEHQLVPSPPETPNFLTRPKPNMVKDKLQSSRGLRVPTSSSSSSSSSLYGTSPSSYSSSPTRICYHARSQFGYDENDELLPPLLPNCSASSIPGPSPIPWGRSSPSPSPRISPAAPTTPTSRTQSSPLALLPSIPREWVHPSPSPSLRYVSSEYEPRETREGAALQAISSKRGLLSIHAKGANEAEAGNLWTGQTKWEVNEEGKEEKRDRVKREGGWKRLLPVSKSK
ncbi:hypothetical protein L202_02752 [Cryptococcus amylolentus CBS 6039]|uniref:Uncharacterized protein n=2 Tax=Cryptococcus amylolentus TaxID=104669 RepID=A0A1E3HW52_9TREE|nr:hypothetical protein L202_02752 [Cryptococcus amylolentus CBS 6039]ODN80547.1 hypothetical protein L202_02752 [Cryptococcus amylolentus CBS 6039]ODO09130.1 hypothetical protein I350_02730 [Cryptococcus amylolentus CBS 6273]